MSIAKASVLFVIAAILAHPYVDGAHEQLEVPRQNAQRPKLAHEFRDLVPRHVPQLLGIDHPIPVRQKIAQPDDLSPRHFGRSRFRSSGSRAAASPMMNTWRSTADRFSSLEAKTVKVTPSV